MSQTQTVERSTFAGGEGSPPLRARSDLAVSQIQVKICENMIVLYEGGLTRRPGTRFVCELRDESQQSAPIPFRFSGADSYLIVINGGKARLLTGGGVVLASGAPYEFDVPWAAADLPNLRPAADGNDIFVACQGYQTRILTRLAAASWRVDLYQSNGGPFDTQNLDQAKTIQASAVTGSGIALTANEDRFLADDIGSIWRLDEPNLSATPYWVANGAIAVGDQRRYQGNTYENLGGTAVGPNPPTFTEGTWDAGYGTVVWRYLHAGYGIVRITAVADARHATADVIGQLPASVVSGATWRWWPPAWSNNKGWPQLATFVQQRLGLFLGPYEWLSRPNNAFDHTPTVNPDSAIADRLRSTTGSLVNIEWAATDGLFLVLGSRDGNWIVRSATLGQALTAASALPSEENREGAASHIPSIVDGGVLSIGRTRKRLFFVKVDRLSGELAISEVTKAARHVLKGKAQWLAWQRDPNRIEWISCQDGTLVGMTWMPEEKVLGLHRHPLVNGFVEWVAAIPTSDEGSSDLYLCVRRQINGRTRRYIEILADYFPVEVEVETATGAWYLDCALEYNGAPTATISNLGHLEGQRVRVFGDGRYVGEFTVVLGAVQLPLNVSQAVVGLPSSYRVKSLPIPTTLPDGSAKGKMQRANHVALDVLNAAGGKIRINDGKWEALTRSGDAPYTGPQKLFTGTLTPRSLVSGEAPTLSWEIQGDSPFPFTLLGVTPTAEIEA